MESHEIYNVWAVGRNYKEHAAEMKSNVPIKPIIFLKPGSSVHYESNLKLPSWAQEIHHEIEVALQFDKNLRISAWTLALDLTERSIQSELKKNSLPWTLSKCFPQSCPIAPLRKLKNLNEINNIEFELLVNDKLKQKSLLKIELFG